MSVTLDLSGHFVLRLHTATGFQDLQRAVAHLKGKLVKYMVWGFPTIKIKNTPCGAYTPIGNNSCDLKYF